MNFKSKKFQNIYIVFLLVAIISIFAINVIQANSATNNSLAFKEKSPILDEEIEAYIPARHGQCLFFGISHVLPHWKRRLRRQCPSAYSRP